MLNEQWYQGAEAEFWYIQPDSFYAVFIIVINIINIITISAFL